MKWPIVFFFLFVCALSFAGSDAIQPHRALKDVCYALVLEGEATQQSVESLYLSDQWVPCQQERLSRGMTSEHLWLRVDLSDVTPTVQPMFLSILVPWIQKFTEYQFVDGSLVETNVHGILKPYKDRTFQTPNFVLPYDVDPNVDQQVLLQFYGVETTTIGGSLLTQEGLVSLISWNYLVLGGALLGIFALMIYNAFLGFSLKDQNYFNYVMYSVTIILLLGAIYGYNYAFFWPNNSWLNGYVNAIASPLTSLALLHFARAFLHVREHSVTLDRLMFILQPIAIVIMLMSLFSFGRDIALQLSGIFGIIVPPLVMGSAIFVWVNGYATARFFVFAWFLTMVSMMSLGMFIEGVIEFSYGMYYGLALAILCEMMLLSLALADKVNHISRERTQANLAALKSERKLKQALHTSAKELELKVRARTDDLEQAKQQAETLARTDELSGLGNRRAFFETGHKLLTDFKLHGSRLLVMLVDIDLFKVVNDTYGHSAGDDVIREVSQRLNEHTSDDITVCRIGGEEYAFLIHQNDINVHDWADDVRDGIAAHPVHTPYGAIDITISGGVAELNQQDESLDDVMLRADRVLYKAKAEGRNKICFDF